MTTRRKGEYRHLELFRLARLGALIIYDEVHLLPAPIFRLTADLAVPAAAGSGLTATLIREDGREGDVFSLIGPKRYDAPWKDIENQGYIAPADCTEVRVTLTDAERMAYATAEPEDRLQARGDGADQAAGDPARSSSGNPDEQVARDRRLPGPARRTPPPSSTGAPIIQGFDHDERSASGSTTSFRPRRAAGASSSPRWPTSRSTCRRPAVAIQMSGTFGSRQEEAQRLRADSCARRPTAGRLTSTPSSPGTPWTRSTPRTASAFLAEQGLRVHDRRRRRPCSARCRPASQTWYRNGMTTQIAVPAAGGHGRVRRLGRCLR